MNEVAFESAGEVEEVQFDLRVLHGPSEFHQPDRGLAVIAGARSIPAHCAVPIPNREHSCQAIRAICGSVPESREVQPAWP